MLLVLGFSVVARAQFVTHSAPVVVPALYASNYSPYAGSLTPVSSAAETRFAPADVDPQLSSTRWSTTTLQPIPIGGRQVVLGHSDPCACSPETTLPIAPTVSAPLAGYPSYAYRPLIPVVSMPSTYTVGRGIIGQPTVYVAGQPIRNFLRYLSP
jgi:hypothetical protein